jgi:hypothetical protein
VLNIEQLLQTGVLQGPYRRAHPVTRRTVIARRVSRALWVASQTLALLLRANRTDK